MDTMYKVLDIAKMLIKTEDFETASGGDNMTNFRLQKMLYYEQGYHLARYGTPLFRAGMIATVHGPIVPSVFDHYKSYGYNPLPVEDCSHVNMTREEEELFDKVYDAYCGYSTLGLANMCRKESPIVKALRSESNEVALDDLESFFKRKLE